MHLRVIKEYLGELGVETSAVPTTMEALAFSVTSSRKGDCPDCIIINSAMENIDVNRLPGLFNTSGAKKPKLILTVPVTTLHREATFLKLGYAGVIAQPIKRGHLFRCIEKLFMINTDSVKAGMLVNHANVNETGVISVLLAEDNDINAIVLSKTLEGIGCIVKRVSNGMEALKTLEHSTFDGVFLDIRMPVMDGITAAAAIRDPSSAVIDHRVPIIVMTASTDQDDEIQCREAGVDYFLSKPARRDQLREVLGRAIHRNKKVAVSDSIPEAILDLNEFESSLDNDVPMIKIILSKYIENCTVQLAQIDENIASGSLETVFQILHTVKGASLTVGAREMAKIATFAGKSGSTTGVAELNKLSESLKNAFIAVSKEISTLTW